MSRRTTAAHKSYFTTKNFDCKTCERVKLLQGSKEEEEEEEEEEDEEDEEEEGKQKVVLVRETDIEGEVLRHKLLLVCCEMSEIPSIARI